MAKTREVTFTFQYEFKKSYLVKKKLLNKQFFIPKEMVISEDRLFVSSSVRRIVLELPEWYCKRELKL